MSSRLRTEDPFPFKVATASNNSSIQLGERSASVTAMLRRTLLPFARLSSSVLNSIKLAKDGKRAGDDEDGGRDAFHTSIQPCGCLGPATLNPHWTMKYVWLTTQSCA